MSDSLNPVFTFSHDLAGSNSWVACLSRLSPAGLGKTSYISTSASGLSTASSFSDDGVSSQEFGSFSWVTIFFITCDLRVNNYNGCIANDTLVSRTSMSNLKEHFVKLALRNIWLFRFS